MDKKILLFLQKTRRTVSLFLNTFFEKFITHDILTLSAALAFYTALSLAPLLLITISVLGIIGYDSQQELMTQVQSVLGSQAGEAVRLVVESAKDRSDLSQLGGIVGIVVLFFTASGVFSQLQYSLNIIFSTQSQTSTGAWSWIRRKLISMGMVLSLGFLSAVSLFVSAALAFIFKSEGSVWNLINQFVTVAVFTLLFAAIYKLLPDAYMRWRDALKGGFVTSVLFALGKQLIGIYIGKSAVGSAYGATGSLLVFLVWVYYSSMILFIGAEITGIVSPASFKSKKKIA